jgi:transmembrane sensor
VSNVVEFEARAAIERQAREWLVRMDGDEPLTEEQIQDLRDWIQRSVLHREELQRICKFWGEANVLTELAVCLDSGQPSPPRRSSVSRTSTLAVAASALLVSVLLSWWVFDEHYQTTNGRYQTGIGQQKLIALSDGSSIRLNTDSQIQVAYDGRSRTIRLLQGEALFSVTPDPNRAFEVYAADSVVRAVGTAFAVHLDERGKVDVTVTKGVVDVAEVSHDRSAITQHRRLVTTGLPVSSLGRLKAGDVTSVGSADDHIQVDHLAVPELQRKMSWQEGYLAFSGEPLNEVVKQVNRYSPVTLEIGDQKLASIPIGGRFRIGDLDAVLDVLETNFGIRARRTGEHDIVLESERIR